MCNPEDIPLNSITFSSLWPLFKTSQFTQNVHAKPEEKAFAEFLFQIGNGTYL